jgi:hypothetical protein
MYCRPCGLCCPGCEQLTGLSSGKDPVSHELCKCLACCQLAMPTGSLTCPCVWIPRMMSCSNKRPALGCMAALPLSYHSCCPRVSLRQASSPRPCTMLPWLQWICEGLGSSVSQLPSRGLRQSSEARVMMKSECSDTGPRGLKAIQERPND